MLQFIQQLFQDNPYHWITIVVSSFVFQDPTTLYVSTGIHTGKISYLYGFTVLVLGLSIGDLGLYFLGQGGRLIHPKKREAISGYWIFFVRFLPGLRIPIYALSGFSGYNIWKYIALNLVSTMIWTAILFRGGGALFNSYGWKGIVIATVLITAASYGIKHFKKIPYSQ